MSAFPFADSHSFALGVLAVSAAMLCAGVLVCAWLVVRRVRRNRALARRQAQREHFQAWVVERANTSGEWADGAPGDPVCLFPDSSPDTDEDRDYNDAADTGPPPCDTRDMAEVLLHLFRVVGGRGAAQLEACAVDHGLDRRLMEAVRRGGTRGNRMCALRALSHIHTQDALICIRAALASRDTYVRLSAAQALVARGSVCHFEDIVAMHLDTFPDNTKGLAALLAGFGAAAQGRMEALVRRPGAHPVAVTAALDALATLGTEPRGLFLEATMDHADARVRSAVVGLGTRTLDAATSGRLLVRGLRDPDAGVRVRAAKAAADIGGAHATESLFGLAEDPSLWVRYWAMRAIGTSGPTGAQFLRSVAPQHPMAAEVMRELEGGYA